MIAPKNEMFNCEKCHLWVDSIHYIETDDDEIQICKSCFLSIFSIKQLINEILEEHG